MQGVSFKGWYQIPLNNNQNPTQANYRDCMTKTVVLRNPESKATWDNAPKVNADANKDTAQAKGAAALNEQLAKAQEEAMLKEAVDLGNKYLDTMQTGLKFAYNTDISNLTVSLLNKANNEVIRQYPTKEMISMTKSFREAIQKMFADPAGILLSNTQA